MIPMSTRVKVGEAAIRLETNGAHVLVRAYLGHEEIRGLQGGWKVQCTTEEVALELYSRLSQCGGTNYCAMEELFNRSSRELELLFRPSTGRKGGISAAHCAE